MTRNGNLGTVGAARLVVLMITLVLAPVAWAASTYKVLHSFAGRDGAYPFAGLIFDTAGNLYGTTVGNACDGSHGTVFKLAPGANGSWTEKVLHSFGSGTDGAELVAGLVFDGEGNLYGATFGGGASYYGVAFELSPGANGNWTEAVLYSFGSGQYDGGGPQAGLIFDATGNLYGTTSLGGVGDSGTVFQLARSNGQWTETVLYSFCTSHHCTDGAYPQAGLIFDSTGNLYGTTLEGGNLKYCPGGHGYGCGTVFRLAPSNGRWTETVLHTFFPKAGDDPSAGLILDPAGNLYGTASGGGATGYGTVFELTPLNLDSGRD
jgi:uncharacterized repeat protein (TIGR03803 family)